MSMKKKFKLTSSLINFLIHVEGYTLAEIGRVFNLSRERIRQIKNKTTEKD